MASCAVWRSSLSGRGPGRTPRRLWPLRPGSSRHRARQRLPGQRQDIRAGSVRRKGLKAAGLDGAGGARHGDQAEGTASDSPGWAGPAPSSKYAASVGACLQAPISLPPTRRYLGGRAHAVPAPTSSHDEGSRASLEMLTARTFRLRALCAHSLTARLRAAVLTTLGFTGLGRAPWSRTKSSCFPRKAAGRGEGEHFWPT